MPAFIDLIGRRFERLIVLYKVDDAPSKPVRWMCRCDCGVETIVHSSSLRTGRTKSCGCLSREVTTKRNTKHGQAKRGATRPEYAVWNTMKQRCTNPNTEYWEDYGGRGIVVCSQWMESFEVFLKDVGSSPGRRYSLERKDNSKGYEPDNVVWATRIEQARNTRANHVITFNGKTQCVAAWAEELSLGKALQARLDLGWSNEKALTTPIGAIKGPAKGSCSRSKAVVDAMYRAVEDTIRSGVSDTAEIQRALGLDKRDMLQAIQRLRRLGRIKSDASTKRSKSWSTVA